MSSKQVLAWNRRYPVGSPGVYEKGDGTKVAVRTISPAWLVCQEGGRGLPLVKLDDYRGGMSLSRLTMTAVTPPETYSGRAVAEVIAHCTQARARCLALDLMDEAAALSAAIPLLQQYRDLRAAADAPKTALASA